MPIRSPRLPGTSRRTGHILLLLAGAALAATLVLHARAEGEQAAVLRADPEHILDRPALRATAVTGGRRIFAQACATCHGAAGRSDVGLGIPDLTDGEYLFGTGRVSEVEDIVRHGIRSHDPRGANLASMPAYARAVPYRREQLPSQTPAQIEDLTQSLLWFTGRQTDIAAARRGREAFRGKAGCWDCHGGDAGGDAAIGAPSLSDDQWLYGDSRDAIHRSIAYGRAGIMPAFHDVLTAAQLRNVAVYVASLNETGGRH